MKKKYTFFQNIPFLCKFQKQPALAEEAPVVSTTLSIPFSGPAERSLYFTENPDFTAPSAGIYSRRFPGSRIFLYSSDPEHDLAAVPSSLFDVLHRYFAVHSPDDIILWKDGILSFQTMENQPQPLTALCTPDDARDSKIIPFPTLSERQRISQQLLFSQTSRSMMENTPFRHAPFFTQFREFH